MSLSVAFCTNCLHITIKLSVHAVSWALYQAWWVRRVSRCVCRCCQWHALDRSEQAKYYEMARKEKELHQQLYPGWSARDNYACQAKKKKRKREITSENKGQCCCGCGCCCYRCCPLVAGVHDRAKVDLRSTQMKR